MLKKSNKEHKNNLEKNNIKNKENSVNFLNDQKINENVKKIEKEMLNKKCIPIEEENKLNKKVFENLIIAILIMIFLYFVGLGSLNIESSIFLIDLKVFSITLIIFTIILFEYSYRKENTNICIHGIETFFLSVVILVFTCIYTLYIKEFNLIVAFISYIFAIYYVGKSMILYKKMKKEYIANLSDIEEIIKNKIKEDL